MRLAFIDVETTGARATRDRIIEIAIKVVEPGAETLEWESFVDPGVSIPPFITQLTGIDAHLVKGAPSFEQVADKIEALTDGCIFVAHNARFDYAFVKNEFKRLEMSFSRKVLCTVKLAKALYPQYRKHGLDALIDRHDLPQSARHRAMGDVLAMESFFNLARQESSSAEFDQVISQQLKRPSLPKGLDASIVNAIPDVPGVYRFYGDQKALLYVGKSVNLYQRVMSHFSSDYSSTKEMAIAQSVTDIEWTVTAGDIGAQLLELKQIKTLYPTYNRRSRASKTLVTFKLSENTLGYLEPQTIREPEFESIGQYFGLYRSVTASQKSLVSIASKNDLCRKLLGLESGKGPCFGYQIGSCKGACIGQEEATFHNLRMQIAFHELRLKAWPFDGVIGIREVHEQTGLSEIHIVYNWCHLCTVSDLAELDEERLAAQRPQFDLDTYRLLEKVVLQQKGPAHEVLVLELTSMGVTS